MIKYIKLSTITFFIFVFFQICAEPVSFQDIFKQIRENEFQPYQTIVMDDGKKRSQEMKNKIIQTALSENPNKLINIPNSFGRIIDSPLTSRSIYETTLFIVIIESNPREENWFLKYMKSIVKVYVYPRCLMILLNTVSNSRKIILEQAWSQKFIHLTILEVIELNNTRQKLTNHYQRNIIIQHLNNFTGKYTYTNYTKGDKIFPTKLKDLNGYVVKAFSGEFDGTDNENDKVDVYINESNAINHHLRTLEALSSAMNFKLMKLAPNGSQAFCLLDNTCQIFLYFYVGNIEFTNKAFFMIDQGSKFLVPILKKEPHNLLKFEASIHMVILSCVFVISIWMILWILKFERSFLHFLHFLELMLGISVPSTVNKLFDRIVLTTLLFGFLLFSSSLSSILLSTRIIEESDDLINSLKDLSKSEITPYVFEGFSDYMKNNQNEVLRIIYNKSQTYPSQIDCMNELRRDKKIACLLIDVNARLQLWKNLSNEGFPTVKVIDEVLVQDAVFIIAEKNSPFVFEFERHVGKIIQSGLYFKWFNDYLNGTIGRTTQNFGASISNEAKVAKISIFIILGIGFAFSIIVFFVELWIHNKDNLLKN